MTTVVVILLAGLIRWGLRRTAKLGAVLLSAAALIWAIYRTFGLQDTHLLIFRPLEGGWIWLFVLLLVATVVLAKLKYTFTSRRGNLVYFATVVGWAAVILAIILPISDIFTSEFWLGWAYGPMEGKWIILALLVIALVFLWLFGKLAALVVLILAGLMAISWGIPWAIGGLTAPVPSVTIRTPSPSTSGVTPSQSGSTTPVVVIPSGTMVTDQLIINWKQLGSQADAAFKKMVDESKPDQGNLAKAKTWDSPADDARLVVIFATKKQISDERARELAGVPAATGDAETDVEVTRATGCYTPYQGDKQVCPSGDQRVVLTLAPTLLVDDDDLGVVDDWGVAIFKTDNGYNLGPITYQ